ncbi:hypothetical protein K438DRAFT_1821120 [Mycena galopus ATCC 62051]|nr:hypothetical protein K438DRAFT_1821120 [Mycena galopus ATCC 62051]
MSEWTEEPRISMSVLLFLRQVFESDAWTCRPGLAVVEILTLDIHVVLRGRLNSLINAGEDVAPGA